MHPQGKGDSHRRAGSKLVTMARRSPHPPATERKRCHPNGEEDTLRPPPLPVFSPLGSRRIHDTGVTCGLIDGPSRPL